MLIGYTPCPISQHNRPVWCVVQKRRTMDRQEQKKMGSARVLRTSDESKKRQEQLEENNKHFVTGEIGPGTQLYISGKLREEYTARSAAIPENISMEEQRKRRTDLKNNIRSRQNPYAKAVVNNIDKNRQRIDDAAAKRGEPSPFKKNHAQSTNSGVNQLGKASKLVGKALIGTSLVGEAYNVYRAPEGKRFKEATRAAGRLGGSVVGGKIGAEIGAVGRNPATVLVGSLIGGAAGSMAGEKAVDVMWDMFGK